MTTQEEILKAYKQGFQDGWKMAMEEMKDFTEKSNGKLYPTVPDIPNIPDIPDTTDPTNPFAPRGPAGPWAPKNYDLRSGCPVCSRKGPDLMVCFNSKCPSRVTC